MKRTAAVYLIESVARLRAMGPPRSCRPCRAAQARCVVGWVSARTGDDETAERVADRAFVWNLVGGLIPLGDRRPRASTR